MLSVVAIFLVLSIKASPTVGHAQGRNERHPNVIQASVSYVPQQCYLKSETGRCRAKMTKYFFNIETGQCEQFIYGGCGGNSNKFETLNECRKTCTCTTPPETGPCRGHFRRWFYSPADGCCRPFIYGGCGGNSNNFGTWTECSNQCFYPRDNSSWWSWGADWGKNISRNLNTSGQSQGSLFYSRQDFIRDWHLWGLLLPEGELDMENIASVIGQAHVVGVGRKTGRGTPPPTKARMTSSRPSNAYGQQYDSSRSMAGYQNRGVYDTARNNKWPYNLRGSGGQGEFGQYGWLPHLMDTEQEGPTPYGASWNTGVWGTGYGRGNLATGGMWGLQGENMETGGQALWNRRMSGVNVPGYWDSGQGQGWNNKLAAGAHGMVGNENLRGGFGKGNNYAGFADQWNTNTNSLNKGTVDNRFTGSGQSITGMGSSFGRTTGNLGSIPINQATSGSTNSGQNSHMSMILEMITRMGNGQMNPSSFVGFAKTFGALNPSGKINLNVLVKRFIESMQRHGPADIYSTVARGLGAVDNNGNVDSTLFSRRVESIFRGAIPAYLTGGIDNTNQPNINQDMSMILEMITRMGNGQMNPSSLIGFAKAFGALNPSGKINVNVLVNRFIDSMQRHGSADIYSTVARGLGAVDNNGNVDSTLFSRRVEAIFRGAIPADLTDGIANTNQPNINQNAGTTAKKLNGTAMKFAFLISRLASGTLLPSDLEGLARRFSVQIPGASVNISTLARRIVDRAMKEPTDARSLGQLQGIADAVGALDNNGNINVELFVSGLAKKMAPAFANEVLVSRHDGSMFNIEGGKGMGIANMIGISRGTQKKKGTYGRK